MKSWAAEELKSADLGDRRRHIHTGKNCIRFSRTTQCYGTTSLWRLGRDPSTNDFWANPQIQAEAIRDCHQQSTLSRVKQHETILAIQDTTELNFTHHPSKKGMGQMEL